MKYSTHNGWRLYRAAWIDYLIDKTFKAVLYPERDCSVNVYDEHLLDNEFLKFIPASYSPNKTLIKKALQDVKEIQGANIVYNDRLTIS